MREKIDELINQGVELWWSGRHTEAGPFFRDALELTEALYGSDASEMIRPLFWLSGSVATPDSTDVSQICAGIELILRALRISENHFGVNDRRQIRILSTLATNFNKIERHEDARSHLVRALGISETHSGEGGHTPFLLMQLTDTLLDMKLPAEAIPFAERALRLEEPRTDELSPIGIGYACRALGRCLMGVGRNQEAITYLERSLALFKVRHPNKKIICEDEILGWIEELRKRS